MEVASFVIAIIGIIIGIIILCITSIPIFITYFEVISREEEFEYFLQNTKKEDGKVCLMKTRNLRGRHWY